MKTIHSVSVSRIVQADRTRVFEAFSSAGALSQWFSPSPEISVDVEAFEFVPTGKFRLRYSMPDGTQPVVAGVYELIEPPHRIAFSWIWQAPYPHAGIPTRVSVRFAEKDAGTEITITHDRLPSEEGGRTSRRRMERDSRPAGASARSPGRPRPGHAGGSPPCLTPILFPSHPCSPEGFSSCSWS